MSKKSQNNKGGCRQLEYNDIVFCSLMYSLPYCWPEKYLRLVFIESCSKSLSQVSLAVNRDSLSPDMEQTNEIDQEPE